jgi:hypothetical protein
MFKLTKLITFADGVSEAERADAVGTLNRAVTASPMAVRSLLQPTLPGVYNGGHYIWHVQFEHEQDYRACLAQPHWREGVDALLGGRAVSLVESAAYQNGKMGAKKPGIEKGVYRVALFAVGKPAGRDTLARYEAETAAMPDYIKSIRNWAVSPVLEASGSRRWSFVWEQEYDDIGGLMGPYMMHPHHWAHVDRWYDPEMPEHLIDTFLCHTFCNFESSVIAPRTRR